MSHANFFHFSSIKFSNFLSTAILIDQKGRNIENNEYSMTLNLVETNYQLQVKNCKFLKCQSAQGFGGGIFYRYNGTEQNPYLHITKCAFVSCSAMSSACFYANGCNCNIQDICAMSNLAKHIQVFECTSDPQLNSFVECQYSHFDQSSILTNAGESTSLFINSQSTNFKLNNHTRCSVHDSACCGYFASGLNLKYTKNSNVNCTGSNYIIFYARRGNHKIEDSLFYMCHSYNELSLKAAIFFSGSKIVINKFYFYRTQLNDLAKPIKIESDASIGSKIYFVNCNSDVNQNYIKYNTKFIFFENFAFENTNSIALKSIDYALWKCATNFLPSRSRIPTMSLKLIEEDQKNKKNDSSKSYSNTYLEIILYFGLTIIILITLNIQLIDYRQNTRAEYSSIDESSVLIDHTDYDASFEDDSIEIDD